MSLGFGARLVKLPHDGGDETLLVVDVDEDVEEKGEYDPRRDHEYPRGASGAEHVPHGVLVDHLKLWDVGCWVKRRIEYKAKVRREGV